MPINEFDRAPDEISFLALGTVLLRCRWRIVRLLALGAVVAVTWALVKPDKYVAMASFVPVAPDASKAGLASLAGQFGLSIPGTDPAASPEFYASLLQSRELLHPIALDTFSVAEEGGRRVPLVDLLRIPGAPRVTAHRADIAVKALRQTISVSPVKTTGVVVISANTKWRSVSLSIVNALIVGLNDYNQRTKQGQATAERKFVEGRLAIAGTELRAAEERMRQFLEGNRNVGNLGSAPELTIQRERIQREVGLRQEVYSSLMQSYEEARVREVRDVPAIKMVESPWAPVDPEPRGLALNALLGALIGAVVAAASGVAQEMTRRRGEENAEVTEFAGTLEEVKGEVFRPVRWVKQRVGR